MRRHEIQLRTVRHDAERIDMPVRLKIMTLDVLHVHRLRDTEVTLSPCRHGQRAIPVVPQPTTAGLRISSLMLSSHWSLQSFDSRSTSFRGCLYSRVDFAFYLKLKSGLYPESSAF